MGKAAPTGFARSIVEAFGDLIVQHKPLATGAVSVYNPPLQSVAVVKSVTICNSTANPATFRIFFDRLGSTLSESTALFWDEAIAANTTRLLTVYWPLRRGAAASTLGVRSSVGSALTFTFWGDVIT